MNNENKLNASRQQWDNAAAEFDSEPDHGLRDPVVHKAWANLMEPWLPPPPANILDIGCGTGSLSVLIAALGHRVTAVDFSSAMIAQAEAKAEAANVSIIFHVIDASQPELDSQQFNVIVCRHLLWALPEPAQVLKRWIDLLTPGGRLILIEGYWHTGAGLHSSEIVASLPSSLTNVSVQMLSEEADLWGGSTHDERYLIVADLPL